MKSMFLTLAALCLPLGAVAIASFAGALLAPLDSSCRRIVLRSQWSPRQTPTFVPPCRSGVADPASAEAAQSGPGGLPA